MFQNSYDFGENSGPKYSQPAEMPAAMEKVLQNGAVICSGNLVCTMQREEGNTLEILQKRQILVQASGSKGVCGSVVPVFLWRLVIEKCVQLYLNTLS